MWTHLDRRASPLLRYRSSDLATVWTAACPCGRATPRIRIDGRRDDMPPLHVYVEGGADAEALRAALRTDVRVHSLAPGALPVAEHKTARVFRTARGDELPPAIAQTRGDHGQH